MTPKQKRAYRRAAKAILELAEAAIDDGDSYNAAMAMVAASLGSMIGTASAIQAKSVEETHEATVKAARFMQKSAAGAYGQYLAAEQNAAGRPF